MLLFVVITLVGTLLLGGEGGSFLYPIFFILSLYPKLLNLSKMLLGIVL